MTAISTRADLQWLKGKHHKYRLTDQAFNKCITFIAKEY